MRFGNTAIYSKKKKKKSDRERNTSSQMTRQAVNRLSVCPPYLALFCLLHQQVVYFPAVFRSNLVYLLLPPEPGQRKFTSFPVPKTHFLRLLRSLVVISSACRRVFLIVFSFSPPRQGSPVRRLLTVTSLGPRYVPFQSWLELHLSCRSSKQNLFGGLTVSECTHNDNNNKYIKVMIGKQNTLVCPLYHRHTREGQ